MVYQINDKAIEIIDAYMDSKKAIVIGAEGACIDTFKDMCNKVFREKCVMRFVYLKGEEPRFTSWDIKYDTYFQGYTWHTYCWMGRSGYGYKYFLKAKCEKYFQDHAEPIINLFIAETYKTIENAVRETDCFLELWNAFDSWFDDRRNKFMENMKTDIQEIRGLSTRKTPQSHGGVANLLKVLTKTMEKQGSDIASIAKVQYAVCVQAGIYIPDEFIRDVAVALDMGNKNEKVEVL